MMVKPTSAWFTAAIALVALALQGCASMNKGECLAVDWRTVGYEDGVAGRPGERIAEHRKACAKYGVTPDLVAYQAGRSQGLREYCRPQQGYQLGEHGGSYGGVCPADLDHEFTAAYESGRELYNLRSRVAAAASRLDAAHRELEHAEHEIVEQSALIVSNDATTEARAHALVSTKDLAERVGRLKGEIADLERDKAHCERDLANYHGWVPPGA
jgi:hypothetical protein